MIILQFRKYIRHLFDTHSQKWLWLGLSTLLLGSFIVVTSEMIEAATGKPELIGQIDEFTIHFLSSMRNPFLNGIAVDITALGSASVLIILVTIFSLNLLFMRKFLVAGHLVGAALGSGFLTIFLKSFFERSRPDEILRLVDVQGYSYPSGHSLSAAAVYFTIAIICCQTHDKRSQQALIYGVFTFLIFAIGISRIFLGVHYFSDVTAGILLGIAWASLLGFGISSIESWRAKNAI